MKGFKAKKSDEEMIDPKAKPIHLNRRHRTSDIVSLERVLLLPISTPFLDADDTSAHAQRSIGRRPDPPASRRKYVACLNLIYTYSRVSLPFTILPRAASTGSSSQ